MINWNPKLEKEEFKAILEDIISVYRKYGFPQWLEPFTFKRCMEFDLIKGTQKESLSNTIRISGTASISEKEKVNKIKEELQKASKNCDKVELDIKSMHLVGDQFSGFKNTQDIFGDDVCKVEHKEGEVLLIYFW